MAYKTTIKNQTRNVWKLPQSVVKSDPTVRVMEIRPNAEFVHEIKDAGNYLAQFKSLTRRECHSEKEYTEHPSGYVYEIKENRGWRKPEEEVPEALQLLIDFSWSAEDSLSSIGDVDYSIWLIPGLQYYIFAVPPASFLGSMIELKFHSQLGNMERIPAAYSLYSYMTEFPKFKDDSLARPARLQYGWGRSPGFDLRRYPEYIKRNLEDLKIIGNFIKRITN